MSLFKRKRAVDVDPPLTIEEAKAEIIAEVTRQITKYLDGRWFQGLLSDGGMFDVQLLDNQFTLHLEDWDFDWAGRVTAPPPDPRYPEL